jgi:hypothetical protein
MKAQAGATGKGTAGQKTRKMMTLGKSKATGGMGKGHPGPGIAMNKPAKKRGK